MVIAQSTRATRFPKLICALAGRGEEVVAAASLMFDPAVARLAEMMAAGQALTKAQAQWVFLPCSLCHSWISQLGSWYLICWNKMPCLFWARLKCNNCFRPLGGSTTWRFNLMLHGLQEQFGRQAIFESFELGHLCNVEVGDSWWYDKVSTSWS